ncbi:MAG: hypothetical protein WCJ23_01560 [Verrucomicrobiota bacterium]
MDIAQKKMPQLEMPPVDLPISGKQTQLINGESFQLQLAMALTMPEGPAKKSQMGSSAAQWPFDQPFWLKLNLAIGGPYGGDPSSGTFPKVMEVDWVRIYQESVSN